MSFDEAPYPSVEDEPIARIRTFSPFCRAWVTMGSVAGAAMSAAGTSQGGLIGGATGGAPRSSAREAGIKRQASARARAACLPKPPAIFRAIPPPMR